ncbi:hypothetical protein [[Mycoplasma] collis]|uniref:hypothetical protein n=1 Tax=[Mycoplasma] collis TaxID=2127 RepID=UPI00051C3573|nr:hypothetical protein [[Mycoplasma] collis]
MLKIKKFFKALCLILTLIPLFSFISCSHQKIDENKKYRKFKSGELLHFNELKEDKKWYYKNIERYEKVKENLDSLFEKYYKKEQIDLFIWDSAELYKNQILDNKNLKFKQEFLDKIQENKFFTVENKNEFLKYFDKNFYFKENFKNLDINKFFQKFNILVFYDKWGKKYNYRLLKNRFYRTINEKNNEINVKLFHFSFISGIEPAQVPTSDIIFFAYDKKYKINVDASNLSNLTLEQKIEFLEKIEKDYGN